MVDGMSLHDGSVGSDLRWVLGSGVNGHLLAGRAILRFVV